MQLLAVLMFSGCGYKISACPVLWPSDTVGLKWCKMHRSYPLIYNKSRKHWMYHIIHNLSQNTWLVLLSVCAKGRVYVTIKAEYRQGIKPQAPHIQGEHSTDIPKGNLIAIGKVSTHTACSTPLCYILPCQVSKLHSQHHQGFDHRALQLLYQHWQSSSLPYWAVSCPLSYCDHNPTYVQTLLPPPCGPLLGIGVTGLTSRQLGSWTPGSLHSRQMLYTASIIQEVPIIPIWRASPTERAPLFWAKAFKK